MTCLIDYLSDLKFNNLMNMGAGGRAGGPGQITKLCKPNGDK
jgi:hypothetical protein